MRLDESALRSGYRINSFETLASTSDEALRRAIQGDRGPLWIVAAQQLGGRGRLGRHWVSPPGNVYASLLLVDAVPPATAPQLGFVAGVAAAEALLPFVAPGRRLALKWPNDVLVDGAKLAGILVEGSRLPNGAFASIVGFGVNRQSHPADVPYEVTDLFTIASSRPSVEDVVAALSKRMMEGLAAWDAGRRFADIRRRWLELAIPPGTTLGVTSGAQRITGQFETIDEAGRLVLADGALRHHIEAGDVFMTPPPEPAATVLR